MTGRRHSCRGDGLKLYSETVRHWSLQLALERDIDARPCGGKPLPDGRLIRPASMTYLRRMTVPLSGSEPPRMWRADALFLSRGTGNAAVVRSSLNLVAADLSASLAASRTKVGGGRKDTLRCLHSLQAVLAYSLVCGRLGGILIPNPSLLGKGKNGVWIKWKIVGLRTYVWVV